MGFAITTVPHAIAIGFEAIAKGAKFAASKVASITASEAAEAEKLTALVPVLGAPAVRIERAGYASLGLVVGLLTGTSELGTDGAAAATQLFLDAGADAAMIQDFKDLYSDSKTDIATFITAFKLTKTAPAATTAPSTASSPQTADTTADPAPTEPAAV